MPFTRVPRKALFVLLAISAACGAQTTKRFEEWHDRGLKENPAGVMLHLGTKDDRTAYHASEIITLQLLFTNSTDDVYTVEASDVGHGDEVVLQRSDVAEPSRLTSDHGVACCSDVRRPLGRKPTVVPSYFHLRLKPGEYSLYLKTQRVSRGWPEPGHYGEGPAVTSDVLHISVAPDKE
jgi:hypothetical protein